MKKITTVILSAVAMFGLALVPLLPSPTYAATGGAAKEAERAVCEAEGYTYDDTTGCDRSGELEINDVIHNVINVMLFIIGILSVIMIIFGGIKYTTSAGDKSKADSAKSTIIYAVVGLVVAIVAFALVQWVFSVLSKS
jgi:hypothetical protein